MPFERPLQLGSQLHAQPLALTSHLFMPVAAGGPPSHTYSEHDTPCGKTCNIGQFVSVVDQRLALGQTSTTTDDIRAASVLK